MISLPGGGFLVTSPATTAVFTNLSDPTKSVRINGFTGPAIVTTDQNDISYFYDENGAFAGSGQVTANVHLTSANSLTSSATIAVYDADGNLLFTFCGHEEATRFQ